MTKQLYAPPPMPEPPQEFPPRTLSLSRRASRKAGLFEPSLMRAAFKQSFVMLRPDIQWKNPVMFVVEIGTVLSILYTIEAALGIANQERLMYFLALDFWLFATVLFANFATSIAEARGKAQAESLRKTMLLTSAEAYSGSGEVLERTVSVPDAGRRSILIGDRERPVVFYCRVGARSEMAAQAFRGAGFEAYSMRGGLQRWAQEGHPLSPEGGEGADH